MKPRNKIEVYFESKAEMERVKKAAGITSVSRFLRQIILEAIDAKKEKVA